MPTYFHDWRQIAGCVTLVMVMVFMGGWLRSLFTLDYVVLSPGMYWEVQLLSMDHSISVSIEHKNGLLPTRSYFEWQTAPSSAIPNPENLEGINWYWKWRGFGIAGDLPNWIYLLIPYWSIIVSLTLLSAYLLLSKPRNSTDPKPDS